MSAKFFVFCFLLQISLLTAASLTSIRELSPAFSQLIKSRRQQPSMHEVKNINARYLPQSNEQTKEAIITVANDPVSAETAVVSPDFDARKIHSHGEQEATSHEQNAMESQISRNFKGLSGETSSIQEKVKQMTNQKNESKNIGQAEKNEENGLIPSLRNLRIGEIPLIVV